MTQYDLHRRQVNLTMVSAHYALKQLYEVFGADLLRDTIHSFEERDRAQENTPVAPGLTYVKGSELFVS